MKQQATAIRNIRAKLSVNDDVESLESIDREDSGIQTMDVSCAVSQADGDQVDQHVDDFQQVMQEKTTSVNDNTVSVFNEHSPTIKVQVVHAESEDETCVSWSIKSSMIIFHVE